MPWILEIYLAALEKLLSLLGLRWLYIAAVTLKRDILALSAYIKLTYYIKTCEVKNLTVPEIFEECTAYYPHKYVIISDTQKWTFRDLNEYATRITNTFLDQGFKKGDVVGLLLENRAEFVGFWLGLSKVGIVTSLINRNLCGQGLLHSINVAQCKALIYGETFVEEINSIYKDLPPKLLLYQFNNKPKTPVDLKAENLTKLMMNASNHKLPPYSQRIGHHDKLMYIYTSGTTGLPKAAVISNSRYLFITAATHFGIRFRLHDVIYTPLPLYHAAAGIMGMGQGILFGSTVAIRKKFSASGYFADCVKFNATVGQYIGEMARYVLTTPPSENDRKHNVRIFFGNGLRSEIWTQFVRRFNIPKVREFYGITEGNVNITNTDSTVGAIGFVSRILPQIYPVSIIRANPVTGEPIRGPDGLCQICGPNEPGVFIGEIIKGRPSREFLGYVDEMATKKKVIHNVFKEGDMAFLSGDILVANDRGYLFFKDRTGDTFRWKGENVSTSEVESQVSVASGYKSVIVFGVSIPHTEGRAGMAAIFDPDNQVNLDDFSLKLKRVLPTYAKPQFLRLLTKVDMTGTFKLRKVVIQKEGYDPHSITDPLYYLTSKGKYEQLTPAIFDKIQRGELRF